MVLIDTSAWIEFLNDGRQDVAHRVEDALESEIVAIGDLIYCEVMQGLHGQKKRVEVSDLLRSLPRFDLCGFEIAEKASANHRHLRSRGITIRKTIDVIIGTFCIENDLILIHNDIDFTRMASALGLKTQ